MQAVGMGVKEERGEEETRSLCNVRCSAGRVRRLNENEN